ncbi:hypothetical protein AB0J35_40580 [Nonomuraea angiospora]|uniref:hypothetical protein n=1 Tax=Nonomuraea angiospora TaxID=46172 RepID=UPI00344596EC
MTHPTVERADNRYQIRVDGEPAGLTEFRDRDAQRVFIHTETTNPVNRDILTWLDAGQ